MLVYQRVTQEQYIIMDMNGYEWIWMDMNGYEQYIIIYIYDIYD